MNPEMERLKEVYGKSYLDYMRDSISQLKRKLGSSDQSILSDYLEEVYEMEKMATQLNASPGDNPSALACSAPTGAPSGTVAPNTLATSFYVDFAKFSAMAAVLGMKCDRVRTGAMMFATESTYVNYRNIITGADRFDGVDMNANRHLETAHHENNPVRIKRLLSIHHLEVKIFKHMLDLLKSSKDPDGSPMLDSTVLMLGGNLSDGNSHDRTKIVRVCAGGKSLGIRQNRVLDSKGKQLSELYLSLANHFDCGLSSFGTRGGRSTNALSLV